MLHAYPCVLKPEKDKKYKGWFNVSFPDVPEALTCGKDEQTALKMAEDVLAGALAWYVHDRRKIPEPGSLCKGRRLVALPDIVAVKISLYRAMRAQSVTKAALAKRLGVTKATVEKITDPDNRAHMMQARRALTLLGRRLVIEDLAA